MLLLSRHRWLTPPAVGLPSLAGLKPRYSLPLHIDRSQLPQSKIQTHEGNPLTLNEQSFGERYTLIVFWSTTCGFCMQEMPHEVELAKLYEPLGLRVIGVNSDESTELAKAAVQENGVPWLNLFEGPDQKISKTLGVKVWPTLLLVDSQGKIIAASPLLRSVGAEVLADGSTLPVTGLDWILKSLFNKK